MRLLTTFLFLATVVFAQSTSKITIVPPQNDSTTGSVDFREKYQNGQNYVGWQAPDNIKSSFRLKLPSTLPTNSTKCLTFTTAGVSSYVDCSAVVSPKDYDWTVTGTAVSSGSRTVTFSPCPLTASDTSWSFRVAQGVTNEIVVPTGGTCVVGAATGTIQFTLVNSYSTPIYSSASNGLLDSIHSVADGSPVVVNVPNGTYNIYADVTTNSRTVTMTCAGPNAAFYAGSNNINMINIASPGTTISGCGIYNPFSKTGITGILINNPSGDTYGGTISNNIISGLENGIKGITWYSIDVIKNRISDCTNAAIWSVNVNTGDAGTGDIRNNQLICSGTCSYLMLHNGPGALVFTDNKLNGATEQMHVEYTFGTASAANSGGDTIITWVSGNKFRSSAVGRAILINGSSCTVDVFTSDTSLKCVGETLGSISASNYYIGATGQLVISRNLFDYGSSTTRGISWIGPISFSNAKIEGNQFINYVVASAKGIEISSTGVLKVSIVGNSFDTNPSLLSTVAIDLTGGSKFNVKANNSSGWKTAYKYGGTTTFIESADNQCTDAGTICIVSTTGAVLTEKIGFTQAQINAFGSVGLGSTVYCTDCKSAYAGCASGGTGANASLLNFTWRCDDANTTLTTTSNCASTASPAVCAAAPVGAVAVAAGSTTLVVNTSAVTANSLILITFDSSLGAQLGAITCNTTFTSAYVSARTAGTSFTITVSAAPVTNKACFSYTIIN